MPVWRILHSKAFRVEPLGEEQQYETVVNGKTYVVTQIKQALYFPHERDPLKSDRPNYNVTLLSAPEGSGVFLTIPSLDFPRPNHKFSRHLPLS